MSITRRLGAGANRRRSFRGIGSRPFWTPGFVAPANRGFWGRGDTIAGGATVTAWNDVWGGSPFTPSGAPARNTGDGNYVGGISIGFLEASSQFLTGPGLPSLYKAISDGTPVTLFETFVCTKLADDTQMQWGDQNATATVIGTDQRFRSGAEGVTLINGNGTSLDALLLNLGTAPNVVHWSVYTRVGDYSEFWCDQIDGYRAAWEWPFTSSADPQGVLRISTRGVTNTEFFSGTVGEFGWFREARGAETASYLNTRVIR